MSFFGHDAVLVDECPRETVAEGVRLERRSLLRFSAATISASLAASCSSLGRRDTSTPRRGAAPLAEGSLDLAEFLTEMYPRAKEFIAAGGKHEEAYLMTVGALMARLEPPTPAQTVSEMLKFQSSQGSTGRDFEMWVVMFDLEPGKGFNHHDHRDYNGIILGVEGEAHVTSYDILGDTLVPPQGETFQIRQTRDDRILPGRFSTLGSTRENVHELKAGPNGAVVLDAFTFLAPGANSYFMDVEPKPRDPERRIYDAAWV